MKHPLVLQETEEKTPVLFELVVFGFFKIDPKRRRKEEVGNGSSTELGIWQTASRTTLLELYFFLEEGEATLKWEEE